MGAPKLSVIVPAFNRVDLLRHTLASVRLAAAGLSAEIIVVDDGSDPPLATLLDPSEAAPVALLVVAQPNAGSAAARQLGLHSARGTWINFLDSDDLVAPEKYHRQLAAMQAADADVSYTDQLERTTDPAEPAAILSEHIQILPLSEDSTDLFLRLHPAPHNLVYHRRLLAPLLTKPWLSLRELYRPVGDIWTFYNLAPFPAKFLHLPLPLTIYRVHPGDRYSQRWEATGIAATGVMLEFMARCPATPLAALARRRVAENAVGSLRALPRGIPDQWEIVLWRIIRHIPLANLGPLGGRWFEQARRMIGLKNAIALFRLIGRPRYRASPARVSEPQLLALCQCLSTLAEKLDSKPNN
jgi:hypothetical protein